MAREITFSISLLSADMSSLGDVLATQAKLESKQKNWKTISAIDKFIGQLEIERRKLEEDPGHPRPENEVGETEAQAALAQFQKNINEDQKETYNAQSKHGKSIAKRFKTDLTAATDPTLFAGKEHLINKAIAINFVRQGQFDIAESFAREAKIELNADLVAQFRTMYDITSKMEDNDLSEAIQWASINRHVLQERNSTLEFELHKAQFIQLFKAAHVFKVIDYAQRNFAIFAGQHLKEIQQLMASTAFHSSITNSPYAHLFLETNLIESAKQSFITEFTALLAMTPTPPLKTTVEAADLALPTLMKLSTLKVATTQGASVDIPLPKELRFHSVFVCPVTKEVGGQAWMLACGHVIGGDAMHSLSKGTPKLKCPYCPLVSELTRAMRLIL